jgi:hypothetical protein
LPAVAVPLSAVVPERALSFFEMGVVPQAAPSQVATPTPIAMVASGATLVSPIVTGPFVETTNGLPVVASCPTVPEKVSVVVTAVGAVVDDVVSDAHAALNRNSAKGIESRVK